MTGKQKRQLFPEKLWELVNRPTSGIKWSPDGKRIEVERGQLERFLQSKLGDRDFDGLQQQQQTKFRSHNFDSFIRQLHFYGFKKCGNSYHHDKFQRGQPDVLHTMKRKYSNLISSPSNGSSPEISLKRIEQALHKASRSSSTSCNSLVDVKKQTISTAIALSAPQEHEQASISSMHRSANELAQQDKIHDLTLYTLKASATSEDLLFDDMREDKVEATGDTKSIRISMPRYLNDSENGPRALVFDNNLHGNQRILTAYFIYPSSGLPLTK